MKAYMVMPMVGIRKAISQFVLLCSELQAQEQTQILQQRASQGAHWPRADTHGDFVINLYHQSRIYQEVIGYFPGLFNYSEQAIKRYVPGWSKGHITGSHIIVWIIGLTHCTATSLREGLLTCTPRLMLARRGEWTPAQISKILYRFHMFQDVSQGHIEKMVKPLLRSFDNVTRKQSYMNIDQVANAFFGLQNLSNSDVIEHVIRLLTVSLKNAGMQSNHDDLSMVLARILYGLQNMQDSNIVDTLLKLLITWLPFIKDSESFSGQDVAMSVFGLRYLHSARANQLLAGIFGLFNTLTQEDNSMNIVNIGNLLVGMLNKQESEYFKEMVPSLCLHIKAREDGEMDADTCANALGIVQCGIKNIEVDFAWQLLSAFGANSQEKLPLSLEDDDEIARYLWKVRGEWDFEGHLTQEENATLWRSVITSLRMSEQNKRIALYD